MLKFDRQRFIKEVEEKVGWLPLTLTIVLHLVFLILIGLTWKSMVISQPVEIPGHINVTIMKASDLIDKKKENALLQKNKLKKLQQQKDKQAEIKRIAQLKAKKRAEAIKKQQALKRKEKAAIALNKAKEQKKLEEKRKKEAFEKKQALAKQKALEKKQEAQKQAERLKEVMEKALKEQKQREAELKQQAELAKQKEEALLAQIAANKKAKEDMSEVAKYTARIKVMITHRWHIPISANPDMKVILKIRLLPTGELNRVSVYQSSGNDAFDNSAMSAVKSISVYPVPEDNALFENNFRQFLMSFSPQDQHLQ